MQLRRNISPLRYPGGKRKFADFFRDVFRENGLNGCRYLEPYAGGAGAALELLRTGDVSHVEINDRDPSIYWFWKAATEMGENFIEKVWDTPVCVDEWCKQREILRAQKPGFELGFAAFFMNRTCVSGVIKRCGGPIGGFAQKGKYKIDCRFHKPALVAKLKFLHENRSRISVTRLDAIEFLRRRAEKEYDEACFFYLDPPYFHKSSELYLNAYTPEDHSALRDLLLGELSDKWWILSYDLCDEVTHLYRHHRSARINAHHALANNGRRQEFISGSDRILFPETI